jgi:plasmid stability protein
MATIHVRNVSDELHEALRRRARERRSSISRETIQLLERALRTDVPGLRELLHEIESDRPRPRRQTPSAAELIREDRDRR